MPASILFILCDQMRADALQYAPNVRALAERGATFSNCYTAAPLCQPARACIATGRFPTEHGVCGNMNEPVPEAMREDTYMARLQRAGYRTALIGKHHFLDRFNVGMDVTEDDHEVAGFGFDDVWQVVDIYESFHNDDRFTAWLKERGRLEKWRERVFSELGTAMMVRDAAHKLVYDAEQGGAIQLFDLRRDPEEMTNLAGVPGYEAIEQRLTEALLTRLIRLTHHTHEKEQNRVQRVRA